jgi:hypothetical protein
MLISPGTDAATPQTVEGQLADLICSDQELLDAEFDAIIAAEWSDLPPDNAGDDALERSPREARHPRGAGELQLTKRSGKSGVVGRSRQRSPPPAAPTL